MSLFFFHVRGDVQRTDMIGVDLKDVEEAWAEALQFAKDFQAEPGGTLDGRRWSVVVNDGGGQFLFQLEFDQTA